MLARTMRALKSREVVSWDPTPKVRLELALGEGGTPEGRPRADPPEWAARLARSTSLGHRIDRQGEVYVPYHLSARQDVGPSGVSSRPGY